MSATEYFAFFALIVNCAFFAFIHYYLNKKLKLLHAQILRAEEVRKDLTTLADCLNEIGGIVGASISREEQQAS